MRNVRLERLLASTALAVLLALASSAARAEPQTEAEIRAAVPLPEAAELSPLTPADVGAQHQLTSPAATGTVTNIPAPAAPAAAAEDRGVAPAATPATANAPAAAPTPPQQANAPAAGQEQAKPTETAAPLDPIAEKLKAALALKTDRNLFGKKERTAVEAFYAARNYAPIWTTNGVANDRAAAAIAYLAKVEADGLDPADYPTPDFKGISDPTGLADAELKLTNSVVTFARHAQIGRVHYSRVSADIYYNQEAPEPGDVLAKMLETASIAEALASYNPPQAGYKALKAKLAEARAAGGDADPPRIPGGPTLKLGKTLMQDARVPQLRERLGLAANGSDTTYDKALADAVAAFQKDHGLKATGQLGNATVDAINGPRRDRDADIIIANMERWRWLPRNLGDPYVMLNIPDFTLRVMQHGKLVWTTRVVTGKPSTATPLLSETMKYITVNPTWNVPPSIVQNEYLPALQQDPEALSRIGLKVDYNRDGTIHIYQPPGDGNALGRIRFNFPNRFLVYQHDTPDKHLFARDERAYSHGCMRVQYPDKYAEVLLGLSNPKDNYTVERIHSMYGGGEIQINLNTPIPVHITYQTAFVDDAGHLQIRKDIYGRDTRLLAQLKGEERRFADIPIERAPTTNTKPVRAEPPRGYYAGGPSFFEILFGGGRPPPPPARVTQRRTYTR